MLPTKDKINVNSYYHQALKTLWKGFKVDAKADDGIIEAIHLDDENQWILGVQFHPEQLIRKDDEFK